MSSKLVTCKVYRNLAISVAVRWGFRVPDYTKFSFS